MADLDNFTQEVSGRIVPPDFDDLVRVSRRRRRISIIGTAAVVAVLAGVGAYATQGLAEDDATPTQPATTPGATSPTTPGDTVATSSEPMTAEEIVRDPSSYLVAFAAAGSDHDVRVSVWRCREQPRCEGWRGGITVTEDGYRTSRVLELPRGANLSVLELGDGDFLVGDAPRGLIVRGDGSTVEVVVANRPGPLVEGEVVVPYWVGGQQTSGALDPESGRVHPLPIPDGTIGLVQGGVGSPMWGLAVRENANARQWFAVVSRDGGASWSEHELGASGDDLAQTIESADPRVMAVLSGGDGATLFPFGEALRSRDDGRTWERATMAGVADTPYVSFGAVLPDGSLLVNLDAWSDDRVGEPGRRHHGLYRSNGDDWVDLVPVESSYPEGTDVEVLRTHPPSIVDWSVAHDGAAVLWGWAPGINTPMMVSTDSGQTWSESAAR